MRRFSLTSVMLGAVLFSGSAWAMGPGVGAVVGAMFPGKTKWDAGTFQAVEIKENCGLVGKRPFATAPYHTGRGFAKNSEGLANILGRVHQVAAANEMHHFTNRLRAALQRAGVDVVIPETKAGLRPGEYFQEKVGNMQSIARRMVKDKRTGAMLPKGLPADPEVFAKFEQALGTAMQDLGMAPDSSIPLPSGNRLMLDANPGNFKINLDTGQLVWLDPVAITPGKPSTNEAVDIAWFKRERGAIDKVKCGEAKPSTVKSVKRVSDATIDQGTRVLKGLSGEAGGVALGAAVELATGAEKATVVGHAARDLVVFAPLGMALGGPAGFVAGMSTIPVDQYMAELRRSEEVHKTGTRSAIRAAQAGNPAHLNAVMQQGAMFGTMNSGLGMTPSERWEGWSFWEKTWDAFSFGH